MVSGSTYAPVGAITNAKGDPVALGATLQDLRDICVLCNDAKIVHEKGVYGKIGEPTEAGMILHFSSM